MTTTPPWPQTCCSLPRRNSILPLSIHTICSLGWLCGSTWTPASMLHHTIIPWSPERMRRLIFSLICSSGKAENVPKPTSVDITSSQVRIASVEVSADDIQAAHEIHLVAVGSALDVWGQYPRRYLRRCALAPL